MDKVGPSGEIYDTAAKPCSNCGGRETVEFHDDQPGVYCASCEQRRGDATYA